MTCRGYDPKAVKVSKEIKTRAAAILDTHKRSAFIRSYVRILESESKSGRQASKEQSK